MNKKIYIILLILLLFMLTSCTKKYECFSKNELQQFGLSDLNAPINSTDYYNKSNNSMLLYYMNVSCDDDVINYVSYILDMFKNNNKFKIYGYAKDEDIFKKNRKIYLSKNIKDYQMYPNNYSTNSVTFNSYEIFYSLSDESKDHLMYILEITSYTKETKNHLQGYNFIISVIRKNYSNYTIVTN